MSDDRAFKLGAIRNEVYVHTSHWNDAQDQLTEAMDLFRWARPFIPAEAGELRERITKWTEAWLEGRGYRSRVSIPLPDNEWVDDDDDEASFALKEREMAWQTEREAEREAEADMPVTELGDLG